MIIGYNEKVNNIIIITNENEKLKRKLGVYGLEMLEKNYMYYDVNMQLHIINMNYVKEIKLYNDTTLINTI